MAQVIKQDFGSVEAFYSELNQTRRNYPQQWIFFTGTVENAQVELKTFNHTYLQVYRVDGQTQTLPPIDCKVGAWKQAILAPFVRQV